MCWWWWLRGQRHASRRRESSTMSSGVFLAPSNATPLRSIVPAAIVHSKRVRRWRGRGAAWRLAVRHVHIRHGRVPFFHKARVGRDRLQISARGPGPAPPGRRGARRRVSRSRAITRKLAQTLTERARRSSTAAAPLPKRASGKNGELDQRSLVRGWTLQRPNFSFRRRAGAKLALQHPTEHSTRRGELRRNRCGLSPSAAVSKILKPQRSELLNKASTLLTRLPRRVSGSGGVV